jgi:type IV pilus assembly protein PilA
MLTTITRSLAAKRARLAEDEKGFTLIELLVVVIIIGILAAIAIPIFLGQQEQAKGSAVENAIGNAKIAVVSSMTEKGVYPATAAELEAIELEATGGDANVDLVFAGDASGFCISGTHKEVPGAAAGSLKSWAADDTSGVVEGTCGGVVVIKAA